MENQATSVVQPKPLTSISVDYKSLYIPVLPKDMMIDGKPLFDESSLIDFFENKRMLGKVSRVDYVTKMMPNNVTKVSVFIHFSEWYENSSSILKYLNQVGEYKITGYYYNSFINDFRLIVSDKKPEVCRFISVKINRTPIPEVKIPEPNVSQLVANNKFMEEVIETQKKKMEEMEAEILALKEEIKKHEESKKPKIDEMDELAEQFSKMTLDELKIDEMDEIVNNFSKMTLNENNNVSPQVVALEDFVTTTEDKTVQVDENSSSIEKTSSSKCFPFQTCFYGGSRSC